jgi:hypothetical protein
VYRTGEIAGRGLRARRFSIGEREGSGGGGGINVALRDILEVLGIEEADQFKGCFEYEDRRMCFFKYNFNWILYEVKGQEFVIEHQTCRGSESPALISANYKDLHSGLDSSLLMASR